MLNYESDLAAVPRFGSHDGLLDARQHGWRKRAPHPPVRRYKVTKQAQKAHLTNVPMHHRHRIPRRRR